jgi:hypothetical protein
MDPLLNAYLTVLEEGKDAKTPSAVQQTKKQVGKPFGDKPLQQAKKPKHCGCEDTEKPQESDKHLSSGKNEVKPFKKNMKKESTNPFDLLYNKIINEEEEMNFSTGDNSLTPSNDYEFGNTDSQQDDDEFGETEESEEEGEQVTFTLDKDLAEKLMEVLKAAIEGESEEEEDFSHELGESEEEEENEEGEGEEETQYEEAVDAEELGHALVDSEKLNKGLNGKSNVVTGAVPVTKKSATVPPTGKGADGKLASHSTQSAVSKLTSKKQDVGGVKVGKTLFDNE